ncbi:DUF2142 domain-containing protein [Pseudomonas lundensis]|uniref:DUF2142 domain-containing protein n=1 Tax=Serratia proteamaculans TaxID=28151 RepID=UPI002981B04C|nr:DUF2142 domain-containing protein [Serratia proteamaculans]MDW5500237.1 DUF2142 domain-containing protein [Serratia proteamaculans]MDW5505303.1 DUF2142 domain-containing protein [Pseudomonas lundensis]
MTKKYGSLFFLFGFLLFSWILVVKPPFSSPDEGNHLSRANGLLQGYFILKPVSADGSSGAAVDVSLDKMTNLFDSTLRESSKWTLEDSVNEMKALSWSDRFVLKGMPNVSFYTPTVYMPQALGFAIGKMMGLDLYSSYNLANAITFSVCLIMLLLAYGIYPIPAFSLVFLLMPMSLFQLFSPTIDGLSMSFTILAMSCFMKLVTDRGSKNYIWLSLLMALCIFSAAGSRANLLLMSFMPLWLFFKNRKRSDLLFFALTISMTFIWTIYSLINTHDGGVGRHPGYSNFELVSYYLKHPFTFASIFINTITDTSTLDFYFKSMVGVLGWLDAPVSNAAFYFFSVAIISSVLMAIFSRGGKGRDTSIFIVVLALLSLLLIFPALLSQWSPFPTDNIIGVQGRYFIIPALILGYAFNAKPFFKDKAWVAVLILSIASTYFVHEAIVKHYYNLSYKYPKNQEGMKFSKHSNLDENSAKVYLIEVPNGPVGKINVFIGNYNNTAKGTVKLEACNQNKCQEALVNASNYKDNSYYEFALPKPIDVNDKLLKLTFHFYKDKSDSPVAIWELGDNENESAYVPKLIIDYIK